LIRGEAALEGPVENSGSTDLKFGGQMFVFTALEGGGEVDESEATPGTSRIIAYGGQVVGGHPEFETVLSILRR